MNPDTRSAYSSPFSGYTASRGSVDDFDTTIVVEQSVAPTRTPLTGASDLPGIAAQKPFVQPSGFSSEPKRIFVVKVCEPHPWALDGC